MHPFFKSNKQIPPPIFSILMMLVCILTGLHTLIRGWINTGRGDYNRIITFSSNPIEFAFEAVIPFLFAFAMAVVAYLGYKQNLNDDTPPMPEKTASETIDTGVRKVSWEIIMSHSVIGAVISIPTLFILLYLMPVKQWHNPGSIQGTLICILPVFIALLHIIPGYMKAAMIIHDQTIKYSESPKLFGYIMVCWWWLIYFFVGIAFAERFLR
jgi:hypothetical protein